MKLYLGEGSSDLDSPLPISITTPDVATLDGVYTCIGIGGGIQYLVNVY